MWSWSCFDWSFPSISSRGNLLSPYCAAWSGVRFRRVYGHFTSAMPKYGWTAESKTFLSGLQPYYGCVGLITNPDWKILTGWLIPDMYHKYFSTAFSSLSIPYIKELLWTSVPAEVFFPFEMRLWINLLWFVVFPFYYLWKCWCCVAELFLVIPSLTLVLLPGCFLNVPNLIFVKTHFFQLLDGAHFVWWDKEVALGRSVQVLCLINRFASQTCKLNCAVSIEVVSVFPSSALSW